MEKKFIDFYEEFGLKVRKVSKAKYGTYQELAGFSSDGEASDWMLGERQIVAFSPELGSFKPEAQTYLLPKNLIFEVM